MKKYIHLGKAVQFPLLAKCRITPIDDVKESKFQVIHPFHPLAGREFDLIDYTISWGDGRVFFYDDKNRLKSIPARWTNVAPIDPYVRIGAGRCSLRLPDLLELTVLLSDIKENV